MPNPLTDNPWLKDAVAVDKSAGRLRTIVVLLSHSEIRALDLSASLYLMVGDRLFKKDSSLTAADDDLNIIIDAAGNRWRFLAGEHYEFGGSWTLGFGAGELMLIRSFVTNVTIPEDFAGSRGIALTVSTLQKIFSVKKNGVEFGTVTFEPATASPVFDCPETVFLAGDYCTVVAPASSDATLANVGLTFVGTR